VTAIGWIIDVMARVQHRLVDDASPMAVLEALTPLLLEFAGSQLILNDDKRAAIQARVHRVLREAHLIPVEDL